MKFTEWSCKKIHFPKNLTSHVHSERYRGNGHNFNGVLHYFVTPVPTINTNKCNALEIWFFLIACANYLKQTLLTFYRFWFGKILRVLRTQKVIYQLFQKRFETFTLISVHAGQNFETFLSYHFTIFSHPPNPQFNDETPHPRFNDVSPLCLCLIIEPGVRGFRRAKKKVSNFVHDWIVGWTKVRTTFRIFHVYQNREKKCKIWNRKFQIWISDFGIHTDPWGPPRGGAQGRHHHKGGNPGAVLTKMLSLNGRPWRSTTVDKTARS